MKLNTRISALFLFLMATLFTASAQTSASGVDADEIFRRANALMEQEKYCEALTEYKKIAYLEGSEGALYNGGLAAFYCGDFKSSIEFWNRLKTLAPDDWEVRAKLVQAYQATDDLKARDAERAGLFEMRKSGASEELRRTEFYCREQMNIAQRKVMVFEYFEMKGPRAVRYSFDVLDNERKEDYRISLGSYNLDNAIWAEQNKDLAAKGQRLFHLDGYYKWGHATYGMYSPEPTYDQVREDVIRVLTDKLQPASMSVIGSKKKDEKK